jgi:hypothetical protein
MNSNNAENHDSGKMRHHNKHQNTNMNQHHHHHIVGDTHMLDESRLMIPPLTKMSITTMHHPSHSNNNTDNV